MYNAYTHVQKESRICCQRPGVCTHTYACMFTSINKCFLNIEIKHIALYFSLERGILTTPIVLKADQGSGSRYSGKLHERVKQKMQEGCPMETLQ